VPADGKTEFGTRPRVDLGLALVRIFMPGLVGAPMLFIFAATICGAVAGLVVWMLPQWRPGVSEWVIVFSALAALAGALFAQVHQWWQERNELAVTINGVVVILFTLYVALAAGGVRYLLYASDRGSLQWADELTRAKWREIAAVTTLKIQAQAQRDAVVADTRSKLARCNVAVVASFADHYRYARGRLGELITHDKGSSCTVWLWGDSNLMRLLPNPSRDQEMVIHLQRGTIDGPRVWFSHNVGLVPEDRPDFPDPALAALEHAYNDPQRADLNELLAFQAEQEASRRRRLDLLLQAAVKEPREQPDFGLGQFVLASIGQFVGAFGDMVKPVSVPAQLFEICVGLLRTIFALVFFERLVNSSRSPR
jgi:hypothetical protein